MKRMKKVLSVFLVFAFILGLNLSSVSTAEASGSDKVKLYKADAWAHKFEGGIRGTIEVENLAYNKKVTVTYNKGGTTWYTVDASYIGPTEGNRELWGFTVVESNPSNLTYRFAIKYEVNGQTYWDNNGGNDYYLGGNYGHIVLGKPTILSSGGSASLSNGQLSVYADLKNLAYNKVVKIVYTTDNWNTTQTADLGFLVNYGGSNNVETWSQIINVGTNVTEVKYALSYTVNGVTYWDNNFGKNYTSKKLN